MAKKSKKTPARRVQGFNVVDNECIWMKAGVINFKLCDQAYNCLNCAFDQAITRALTSGGKKSRSRLHRSWQEKVRHRWGDDRPCRHMLSGRIDYKICVHDFQCDTCEFHQELEDLELSEHLQQPLTHTVFGYTVADNYYAHRGHAWARVEYGGRVRLGLDDFALRLVGKVDEYRLPPLGHRVEQNQPGFRLGREGNEAAVLSPVTGTVVAVNHKILRSPGLAKSSPYDQGWLMVVEPERLRRGLKNLLFGSEQDKWLAAEVQRLHELVLANYPAMAATGGEPVDDVVAAAPEIGWKRLIREFLLT